MKIVCIYQIQSIVNPERFYIGSTVDMYHRRSIHIFYLRENKHHSLKLQRHFNKYGEQDLVFSIIEQFDFISKDHLLSREQYYLDSRHPYFNISVMAGSLLGYKHPEESKKNHSKAKLGFKHSEESRKSMSDNMKGRVPWNKGIPWSDITKDRMRKPHGVRSLSEEHKLRIGKANSIALLGHIQSSETKLKRIVSRKKTLENKRLLLISNKIL